MEFLNPKIEQDLAAGVLLKLELGSAGNRREGFYGLDHLPLPGVDVVADLNQSLSLLPDNSVSQIFSRHVLEHITEFLPLMKELHRVAAPGCVIEIVVPHFSNPYYYSDPTHVRFFGLYTMNYFVAPERQPALRKVPAFYSDTRFEVEQIKFSFYRMNLLDRLVVPFLRKLVNSSFAMQNMYERRLCHFFHASEISYRLTVDK